METSYQELRQKEVVNICDGKRLGRICDIVFTYPEGKVLGIVAPGGRGFRFGKADIFIDLKDINKIGVDVIMVELHGTLPRQGKKKGKWVECAPQPQPRPDRRDFSQYE